MDFHRRKPDPMKFSPDLPPSESDPEGPLPPPEKLINHTFAEANQTKPSEFTVVGLNIVSSASNPTGLSTTYQVLFEGCIDPECVTPKELRDMIGMVQWNILLSG